jgi:hypothetical protein
MRFLRANMKIHDVERIKNDYAASGRKVRHKNERKEWLGPLTFPYFSPTLIQKLKPRHYCHHKRT